MRCAYIALISVALFSAACTTAVDGSAVKETGAAPGPTVDISKLDAGPYPTEPSQPLGVTGDPLRGVLVEAQRMANNVVGPWEVDSTLTKWFGFGATVLQNAGDLAQLGPEPFAAAAGQHGFVNGFVSARTAEGQKILLNAVLRFPDPGAAAAAATEFGDIAAKTGDGRAARADPGSPRHARRRAIPQTEGSTGKRWGAVRAFTPHGQYVFMQLAQAVDGTDPALGLVAKTMDLQGPVIDKFRATDLSEFGDISLDPTGLLARTLPVPDKEATTIQDTTYEQRGALHFQNDPARSATLFSETGTDLVAMAKTNVYQTKDSESAARNRRRVLRRVAADVAAGQAGQQPAGQPLPATGGQDLLLSGCGGPLRNRNHLGEAVGCAAAGGRPVRDAGEQLSFRRARPAAPAR